MKLSHTFEVTATTLSPEQVRVQSLARASVKLKLATVRDSLTVANLVMPDRTYSIEICVEASCA